MKDYMQCAVCGANIAKTDEHYIVTHVNQDGPIRKPFRVHVCSLCGSKFI